MSNTTIYFIRHGETDWNAEGRWQGHADVPLNDIGRRQAQLMAQRLQREEVQFDAIYSSDLARAFQTAWELGAQVRVPVQLLPPLREIDIGEWSGLTTAEIKQRFPVEFRLMEEGQDVPRGGGETLAALMRRIINVVEVTIRRHPGKTLAMVTHGGCIRAALSHALQVKGWASLPHIGNTSITVIASGGSIWQAVQINDVAHLEATHAAELITAPPDDAESPPNEAS
jgi:broad specificity phosphatase PhoE